MSRFKLDKYFFIMIPLFFFNEISFAQSENVEVIYDIDGLIYKKLTDKNALYIDLEGNIKELHDSGNYEIDSLEVKSLFKKIARKVRFPKNYILNTDIKDYTSDLEFTVSLIIEADGSITNLRFLDSFKRNIKTKDILPNGIFLNKINPPLFENMPVVIELLRPIRIACTCASPREKKPLKYSIKKKRKIKKKSI